MKILITGGSGFLGSALIPRLLRQGHQVYSVSRHPPQLREGLVSLMGDILVEDFDLRDVLPVDISSVYHLAAIHRLSQDKDGSIWQTNVEGTRNVIDFCLRHSIERLYFCSTAYTEGRNTYERSKALCEEMVLESGIPRVSIFKPSIVMGTKQHFFPGHFAQFVNILVNIHRRADIIRRKIEGTLRLPILEPVFRINGNPEGTLNLVSIDAVAKAMANIKRPGIWFLTNPDPPTLRDLCQWISESIMVKVSMEKQFTPTPLELAFQKLATAFRPYLEGDSFPSALKKHPPIDRQLISETITETLLTS